MKVFISWSGDKSKIIAEALSGFLPLIIQAVEPWMSAHNIYKGARWGTELTNVLNQCNFGILCLTPDNLAAPWIFFEAGALSKLIDKSHVVPYLLDVDFEDIKGPLEQFNGAKAEKNETRKLLTAIRIAAGDTAPSEAQIDTLFEKFWPEFEHQVKSVTSRSEAAQTEKIETTSSLTGGANIEQGEENVGLTTDSADTLFNEMIDAWVADDLSKVHEIYKKIEEVETDKEESIRKHAIYLHFCFALGDPEALGKLQDLGATDEGVASANFWIGQSYELSENFNKAILAYELAAQKAPTPYKSAYAKVHAAKCLHKTGSKKEAFQSLIDSINETTDPSAVSELYSGLASLYELDNSYRLRAVCLEKALENRPNDATLHFNAGYSYSCEGDKGHPLSVLHYKTLHQFNPDHSTAWNNLGVEYHSFDMLGLSMRAYKKAVELKNTLAASNLAYQYISIGLFEEAKDLLMEAQKQNDINKAVGSALASIIELQEKESTILDKTLVTARQQQRFVLLFADTFFTEKKINPVFGGTWKSDSGTIYTISQNGQYIEGTWTQGYTEYKVNGELRNSGAHFELLKKGYPSSFGKVGHGYMYLSPDGQKLFMMTIQEETHELVTLEATLPIEPIEATG
ncbi:MAG TPA: hypothetical protein VF735_15080 [Pyrinomonadaceae bacterium]|jgi:tetratricopeptide (TPR) repeat protein